MNVVIDILCGVLLVLCFMIFCFMSYDNDDNSTRKHYVEELDRYNMRNRGQ